MATPELKSDEDLASLTSEGDWEAFEVLYARYFDSLYDFTSRLTRSADTGADVTQIAFLRAREALVDKSLTSKDKFKPWLFRVAHNVAMDYWRKSRRTVSYEGDDEGSQYQFTKVDEDRLSDPELVSRDDEINQLVWQAAGSLNSKEYAVLDLQLRKGFDGCCWHTE